LNNPSRKAASLLLVIGALFLLPSANACTVVVDESELQAGCAPDTKACISETSEVLECVSTTNPAYGCASESCNACSLAFATSRCDKNGECDIATCEGKHRDCDGKKENGCEVDTGYDEENCGSCGNECNLANAVPVCSAATCKILLCTGDYEDCDDKASNGCEADTQTSNAHCGGCDMPCDGTCTNGVCL
jgi:hypothetical protein